MNGIHLVLERSFFLLKTRCPGFGGVTIPKIRLAAVTLKPYTERVTRYSGLGGVRISHFYALGSEVPVVAYRTSGIEIIVLAMRLCFRADAKLNPVSNSN